MSTGGYALRLGVKAGMAHSICGCTCGWQVKRSLLTCAVYTRELEIWIIFNQY